MVGALLVGFVVGLAVGGYFGYLYGKQGVAAVLTELVALEDKVKADAEIAKTWVLAEIAKIKAKYGL
jgi:hypothetical protein